MLFPILPTALLLYLIEPIDAELEAAIEAVEVPPMATALAVPVVAISPCTHQKAYSISVAAQSSALNVKLLAASVKKAPVATVL